MKLEIVLVLILALAVVTVLVAGLQLRSRIFVVPSGSVALLYADGHLVDRLDPGNHVRYEPKLVVACVELSRAGLTQPQPWTGPAPSETLLYPAAMCHSRMVAWPLA